MNLCVYMSLCVNIHVCFYPSSNDIFRSLAYAIICALLMNMCRKEKLPWTMPRRRVFLISW